MFIFFLMQIVDARNPYFFYSADLEKYISEVSAEYSNGKEFVLLVNKADYLSSELIAHWNQYFTEKGINHIFFSALQEQTKIDNGELDVLSEGDDEDDSDASAVIEDDEEGEAAKVDIEQLKKVEETHGGFKNELERQERKEKEE